MLGGDLAAGAFTGATGFGGPFQCFFFTYATSLWPALFLGRPGLEGPAYGLRVL
jgi:hypothetical protein